jgi:hypothetical protein
MGSDGAVPPLDERQAFEAMRYFLEAYWERTGKQPDERLTSVLSDIDTAVWTDGSPGDPATWDDWLEAVRAATGKRD